MKKQFTAFEVSQQNDQQTLEALAVIPNEAHFQPGHKLKHTTTQCLQGQKQFIQIGETVRHAEYGREIQRQKVYIESNGQPAVIHRPNAKDTQCDAWQTEEIRCTYVSRGCFDADEHCCVVLERMSTFGQCGECLL